MVSNQDLIRAVFDDDVMKYNKWFFIADWEKAEVVNLETATEVLRIKNIIWNNGTWSYGRWYNGTWYNGTWERGVWYNGTWKGGIWKNGTWEDGWWYNGTWKNGTWNNGTWKRGKIYDAKTKEYIESKVPPNKCKWSLSYGK